MKAIIYSLTQINPFLIIIKVKKIVNQLNTINIPPVDIDHMIQIFYHLKKHSKNNLFKIYMKKIKKILLKKKKIVIGKDNYNKWKNR